MKKGRLKRVARWALVVLVVVAVLGEVALRICGLGNPVLYQTDADCVFLPQPNQSCKRFFKVNQINAYSMRSPEIAASKPAGVKRVMFVGDSVTYGTTYVDQAEIFTSRLARELPAKTGGAVEVLNISCGGWGPANEWGYVRSRGTFGSDVVLMQLNTRDLLQGPAGVPDERNYPRSRPLLAWTEAWSRYALPRISAKFAGNADAGSNVSEDGPEKPEYQGEVFEVLRQMKAFSEAKGAKFGILYVPFRDKLAGMPKWVTARERFVAWCKERGTVLIDTTDEIVAQPETATHFDGAHLRPEGHEIVTRKVLAEWGKVAGAAATSGK